ncbi:MAG: hypothetical protein RL141_192 [Candidatus Parcubacteria bacterium]|jgi:2,3-bisphosphoglycerate-dependent phosphoglycerate mutase
MPHLILVRHGKSEWNALGLWTGWTDVALAEEGVQEARAVAEALRDLDVHEVHVSTLTRAKQTFDALRSTLGWTDTLPVKTHAALNERHYGIHTGKNKWQVKEEVGEETFNNIRRGWDHPVPEGETLKDVHARVVPYYQEEILPTLRAGKNVMIVAHNNSLRALMKHIEDIPDEAIADVELQTGEACCYTLDDDGRYCAQERRYAATAG